MVPLDPRGLVLEPMFVRTPRLDANQGQCAPDVRVSKLRLLRYPRQT